MLNMNPCIAQSVLDFLRNLQDRNCQLQKRMSFIQNEMHEIARQTQQITNLFYTQQDEVSPVVDNVFKYKHQASPKTPIPSSLPSFGEDLPPKG